MKVIAVAALRPPFTDATARAVHASLCAFLPRISVVGTGVYACDLRGTIRLLGQPSRVGRRIVDGCARIGARCAVGIAETPFAARVLAERTPAGEVRAIGAGGERIFLSALPLATLPLDPRVVDELALLGIRRAGEFAELPRGAVLDRFGRVAAHAHALACGEDAGEVHGDPPKRRLHARRRWDDPLTSREQLVFALRSATEQLAAACAADGLAVLRLAVRLERASEPPLRFERSVLPSTADAAALLRSLRWTLEEWPDLRDVVGAAIEATEVEPQAARQLGLFAPDGARAEEALAAARHLRARLGPGAVLRARVVDEEARLPERSVRWDEVAS